MDGIITGDVGRFDRKYQLNVKVISSSDGRELAAYSARVDGEEALGDEIVRAGKKMAPEISERLNKPLAPPTEAARTADRELAEKNRRWARLPTGVGTALAGGGTLALVQSRANLAALAPSQPISRQRGLYGSVRRLVLDDFLPYRLSLASNAVSQVLARAYERQHHLKMYEWRVLSVLAEVKQASQQDLVRLTKMDKVTISRAARVLEKQQLLRRVTSASDARTLSLSLTPRGWALYRRVVPTVRKLEAEVLKGVSSRELAELKAMLRRVELAAARVLARSGD